MLTPACDELLLATVSELYEAGKKFRTLDHSLLGDGDGVRTSISVSGPLTALSLPLSDIPSCVTSACAQND